MLDKQIKSILEQEEAAGMSHREIGKRHHVSHTHITHLLNGKRPVSGLTIETVQKMFPLASFNLNGDGVNAANSGTVHGVVGLNSGTVNTITPAALESFRFRILEAVIDLDIPSDALQTVLKTIKGIKP